MPRILVADDNSNIHRTVTLALKEAGVDVVAVGNGEAAVRKIAEIRPDLVLADIFMPVRNGYEVCEFVKKDPRFAHIPVVLLIGAFDPFDEREAQRVQSDAILKKPFVPPDSLLRMVTDLLAQSAARPETPLAAAPVAKADHPDMQNAAKESVAPEYMDAPPEEFAPAKARLAWDSNDQPIAFGTLLDTTAVTAVDETVVTSRRDPTLGEPAFWAPKVPANAEDDADDEEDESGNETSATADVAGQWRPDIPLDGAHAESESIPNEIKPDPQPDLQESFLDLPDLVSPEKEGTQAHTDSETEAVQYLPELPSLDLQEVGQTKEFAPAAAADSTLEPGQLLQPEAGTSSDLRDFTCTAPIETSEITADQPIEDVAPEPRGDDSNRTTAGPLASGLASLAPFLASLTSAASARKAEERPLDFDADLPLSGEGGQGSSKAIISEPLHLPGAPPLDPALIEAIAQRVIERMQPQIIDLVTRELLRPAVEALVQRELEKK